MGTTVINNFKRPESRHFAFRVIFEKSPKCPTNPSGTHVPEPTAREPAPAVSAHTGPVSSENTVSTFAVNASVRRPPILDLSSTVKVPQWHGTLRSICATVIPCATCAALVPGTVPQTGGGKPSAYTVLVPATTAAGTPGQQTPVVTATAVAGNPTSPVTYTGAASSISAKGAVFGIVVGLFLSLC